MDISKQKSKQKRDPDFKSVFIVDPIKGERLHLAKLLKQEKFLMMSFESIGDCLKPVSYTHLTLPTSDLV